ncbi:MAG: LUD domain-containing protein [Acidobacteriota bacterium]|nr:LUD domain-containing protein [Acidobacteriota bacterium]
MPDSQVARDAILSSIRTALRAPAGVDTAAIASEYAALPRLYKREGTMDPAALLDLFTHRLVEYDAGVYRTSAENIGSEVARILSERGRRRIAIPDGLPPEWLPDGFDFQRASRFGEHQLDQLEGVLTGCTVACAETGSIVLQNAAAQGPRSLTLVPDYHLCVVFAAQVLETVPECFARLDADAALPTTFFSGPSATADIEMTRIKGVHGPRFLDVLLVV